VCIYIHVHKYIYICIHIVYFLVDEIVVKLSQINASRTRMHVRSQAYPHIPIALTRFHSNTIPNCNTRQHTATHGNTLQHTATHCITQQHHATHGNTLQHPATPCNTLLTPGNTATHGPATNGNTLQHMATQLEQTATA